MFSKQVFLVVIALLLASFFAACVAPAPATTGGGDAAVEPAATAADATAAGAAGEDINISYWAFGSEGSTMSDSGELWTDWYAKIFDEYEKAHPGVNIDFALRGYDASGSTLFVDTAVAAGTPPDIYFDTKFRVKKFYDEGLLEDLRPALTEDDIAAYDPAVFAGSYDGDVIWSIPASGGYWNYIINKTAFEKAGLLDLLPKAPDYAWTTDEFLKACRAINNPPDLYCTAFFAGSPSMDSATNEWLAGFPDCEFFDQQNVTYTVNSPACTKAFEFLHTLYDEGLMVPGAAGLIDDTTDPYWLEGKVAMLGQGNWYDKITKQQINEGTIQPFEYMHVQYPNLPGAPVTPVGMSNPDVWGVFAQSDPAKRAAVMDLIHYMQQPEIALQIATGWGKTPVRTDTAFTSTDPAVTAWYDAAKRFGSYNPYFDNGVPCNYNEVRQAWAEARQEIWQDKADIQSILDGFVERANGMIAQCQ